MIKKHLNGNIRKKGKKMGQTLVLPWWRHRKFWKILDPFDEKWKTFGPPNDVTEKPDTYLVHLMTSQEVSKDIWRQQKALNIRSPINLLTDNFDRHFWWRHRYICNILELLMTSQKRLKDFWWRLLTRWEAYPSAAAEGRTPWATNRIKAQSYKTFLPP